jgi:hypothetical protein
MENESRGNPAAFISEFPRKIGLGKLPGVPREFFSYSPTEKRPDHMHVVQGVFFG